jgi:nucleoside-diphosphate-sugar epimerase
MADVRDVAHIHLAAMTSASTGTSRYMVSFTTDPQQFPDIARVLRRHGNKKAPRFTIPLTVLRVLARFNAEIRMLVKSTDGLSMRLDTSTTVKDFGWEPIPFEQSVLDTAKAFK